MRFINLFSWDYPSTLKLREPEDKEGGRGPLRSREETSTRRNPPFAFSNLEA
jgi:hypothetical protein